MVKEQVSKVALLIDADNLPPVAVDLVFEHWQKLGTLVPVRRAYGGHEKLAGMKDVLRRHAVRAFVNQGKGTTDVALVVDAMDMLHINALPATVAIVSSDADFAPLALRLREAGLYVMCFAKRDNSDAEALLRAYDEVVYVDSPQPVENLIVHTAAPVESVAPKKAVAKKAPVVSVPPPVNQVLPTAKPVNVSPAAVVPVALDDPKAVRAILAALPAWLPNTIMQLNQLGSPLRDSGVAKGSKPLHELFRKHPAYFKVLPTTGAAKQVRLLKTPL